MIEQASQKGVTMRVKVDRELCRGHALCMSIAPEVFEVDDAGFVVAPEGGMIDVPAGVDEATVREAVLSCPEGALSVEE
jgi:ferredoxin